MTDKNKKAPASSVLDEFTHMKDDVLGAPTLSPQEIMADIIAKARREKKTDELIQTFQPVLAVFNEYAMSQIARPNGDFGLKGNVTIQTDIEEALENKGPVRIKMVFTWFRLNESDKSEETLITDEVTTTPVDEGFDVSVTRTVSLDPKAKKLGMRDPHSFEASRRCATFGEMDAFLSSRLLFSPRPKPSESV